MQSRFLLFAVLMAATASAQQVNDAVEVEYQGVWYPGHVLKVEAEKYFITYDGWDESWNEWVGQARLRAIAPAPPPPPAPSKYNVGDRVEIQYGFGTVNATVVTVGEGQYELKVDEMSTIWYREDLILRKL